MITLEIIINIAIAIGALATASSFFYMIKTQKGTQRQIESLSQIAQIARIKAGNELYPKIEIALKNDEMWGLKLIVKNNSYTINIYRIVINAGREYRDIKIASRSEYITVKKGESKPILPGRLSRNAMYVIDVSVQLFLITPFSEAYEIRYSSTFDQIPYQSDPIPRLYPKEEKKASTKVHTYSIHGGIKGNVEDVFPEIVKESENEI